MNRSIPDIRTPSRAATRRVFGSAGLQFDEARFVHDEARTRLLERLDYLHVDVRTAVDLGCATGGGALAISRRFPGAHVVALDASWPMLCRARAATTATGASIAGADAERLPLRSGSVDLLFANLLLPWCDPAQIFSEAGRTLTGGGVLLFTTVGPDTLAELRDAWAKVDDQIHVHAFMDMHDLGDLAAGCGLAEPVINVERLQITYEDPSQLIADLRACGAVNIAGGRRRALTGRRRWARFEQGLRSRRTLGRFPVTIELILGHAWGTGKPPGTRLSGAEIAYPAEGIPLLRRRAPPH